MANKAEYDQAINAVRNNEANQHQKHLAEEMARKAGSEGENARQAFKDSSKSSKYGKHWLF